MAPRCGSRPGRFAPGRPSRRAQAAARGGFSDSAPAANDLFVEGHRLADALHAAVLVGLVRELRLARAEHHCRRASIRLQQVARVGVVRRGARLGLRAVDRKSTRLNSSRSSISYAVFCLKKKKLFLIQKKLYKKTYNTRTNRLVN